MKLKKMHWFGIISAVAIVLIDIVFFFNNERMLLFLIGIALGTLALPFVIGFTLENEKEQKTKRLPKNSLHQEFLAVKFLRFPQQSTRH